MLFNRTIRLKLGRLSISALITLTQPLEGWCSNVVGKDGYHYIFMDIDDYDYDTVIKELTRIQYEYQLATMFIMSDKERSYRVYCFSIRTKREYLEILLDAKIVDYNFVVWVIKSNKGTLRVSRKYNRKNSELIAVLEGYEPYTITEKFNFAHYNTSINKLGRSIQFGR